MGVMTDIIQKMRKEFHFMIITNEKAPRPVGSWRFVRYPTGF
jgi:hypothetical protein